MRFDLLLMINGCISALVAILLWLGLPAKLQQPSWPIILLFFSIVVFLPLVGILFLIVAVVLSYWFDRKKPEEIIQAKTLPVYQREKINPLENFGESGAWTRLHNVKSGKSQRIQAMFAVNADQNAVTNNLNLDMLQEDSDQLRLYAFGLLNKQSRKLDQRISALKKRLTTAGDVSEKIKIKKSLAFLYWEFVYTGLVKGDLLSYIEEQVLQYAKEALDHNPEETSLWVLLGKVYFNKKDHVKAQDAFEHAEKLRAPYENILPYLMELSFVQRDFAKVREYFKKCDSFRYISKLHNIIEFWSAS